MLLSSSTHLKTIKKQHNLKKRNILESFYDERRVIIVWIGQCLLELLTLIIFHFVFEL